MSSYSRCIKLGRMVRDAETRTAPSGTKIASGAIAYDTGFGERKKVNFLNFKAFGRDAETLEQYAPKGSLILLTGELQQDRWETNAGEKRSDHVLYVDRVTLMPKNLSSTGEQNHEPEGADDDVPF